MDSNIQRKHAYLGVMAFFLIVVLWQTVEIIDRQSQIDALQSQVDTLQGEKSSLQQDKSSLQSRLSATKSELNDTERQLSQREERIEELQTSAKITAVVSDFILTTDGKDRFIVDLFNYGDAQASDVEIFCGVLDDSTNSYKYGFVGDAGNVAGQEAKTQTYEIEPEADIENPFAKCMTVDCADCTLLETDHNDFELLYEFYQQNYSISDSIGTST